MLLAEPAEDRLGHDGVAAQGVQQAGGAGLRGEAGDELRHHQAGQEHGTEQETHPESTHLARPVRAFGRGEWL